MATGLSRADYEAASNDPGFRAQEQFGASSTVVSMET